MSYPTFEAWIRQTSVTVGRRGRWLSTVDYALQGWLRDRNKLSAAGLDNAIRAYQAAEPGWCQSSRNRTGIMSRMFAQFAKDLAPWQIRKGFVWSPIRCTQADDKLIFDGADNFIKGLGLHPEWQIAGESDLSKLAVDQTLYVLAHGHVEDPVFKIDTHRFTPTRMVELLEKGGFRREHNRIVLLVCHAGESINTVAAASGVASVRGQLLPVLAGIEKTATDSLEGIEAMARLEAQKTALQGRHTTIRGGGEELGFREPKFFESFSVEDARKQLLPLAASFSAALKAKGYTNFVMKSFKAEVVNHPVGGEIVLKLWDKKKNENAHIGDAVEQRLLDDLPAHVNRQQVPVSLIPTYCVEWR